MVNTRFWSDNFIAALSPIDRYFFLYLLTNEHTNIAGVYELPLRTLCFEAAITPKNALKAFERLTEKLAYIDGWVFIKNFQKHQSTSSDKIKRGIEIEMDKVPAEIRGKILERYPMYTLFNQENRPSHPNPNSNLNPNPNARLIPQERQTPRAPGSLSKSLSDKYKIK